MGKNIAAWLRGRLGNRGSVSLMMAGSAIPLIAAIGTGVDMGRLTLAKTTLQAAVDGAALAGASAYGSPLDAVAAKSASIEYFNTFKQAGTVYVTSVAASPAPGNFITSAGDNASSMNVTVSASADMPTTFMQVAGYSTMAISARAVAVHPLTVGAQINPSVTNSDAYDWNVAYAYAVPLNADGTPNWSVLPPKSEMIVMGDNCNAKSLRWSSPTSTTPSLCNTYDSQAQTHRTGLPPDTHNNPIAILLLNMTGGLQKYGIDPKTKKPFSNQYGSVDGNIVVLSTGYLQSKHPPSWHGDQGFSAPMAQMLLTPVPTAKDTMPIKNALPPASSTDGYSHVGLNCALKTAPTNTDGPPVIGTCYPVVEPKPGERPFNLSCDDRAGRTFTYWWNDMGQPIKDDRDYNDMVFDLACVTPTQTPVLAPIAMTQ